jgi:predicted nucleic acid-binding protein
MIVIDASIAAKWILENEQDTEKALIILASHISSTEKIIVPDLFFYEIANTLVTKSGMTVKEMTTALEKIYQTNLYVYHPLEADVSQTTKLAKKYRTTVYDMLYATVARRHKASLITADEQFIKQTGFKFVKLL